MGTIVAIGGGELKYSETLIIDQYLVSLSKKKKPKALFIPTASHEAKPYIEVFEKVYGELGCYTSTLYLIDSNESLLEVERKILEADIIYVGGGNTKYMLDLWKEKNVDLSLKKAFERGKILAGLSAGSICWFEYGHSDFQAFNTDSKWNYQIVQGLELIKGIHCPHYNEDDRRIDFDNMMKEFNGVGIALENNSAIVIKDNQYKIIKANEQAKAYRVYNRNKVIIKEELQEDFSPLSSLYKVMF